MNRRNFILGLGTAATLSGAASVTGAALQDTVTPEADFRVIAEQNLEVRRNEYLDPTGEDSENYTDVDFDNFDFNGTAGTGNPKMKVDNGSNDDLQMALATVNKNVSYNANQSEISDADLPYVNSSVTGAPGDGGEAPLEINNPTGETKEIGVEFSDFGEDVADGSVNEGLVLQLFTFHMAESSNDAANGASGGDGFVQISPDDKSQNDSGLSTNEGGNIGPGETRQVHLKINMSDDIQSQLQDAANTTGGGFSSSATDDLNLLDTVEFGTIN